MAFVLGRFSIRFYFFLISFSVFESFDLIFKSFVLCILKYFIAPDSIERGARSRTHQNLFDICENASLSYAKTIRAMVLMGERMNISLIG